MDPTIRRGSIAVRLEQFEGACAIKRVKKNHTFWIFLSDNPEVEPIALEKKENPNPIIGRVIWSWTSWVR